MRVKELIEILKDMDGDRVVVMSSDSEGNSYSPLADLSERGYEAETAWAGSVYLEGLNEEDIKAGYTEDDVNEDAVPCVVLWPVR